MGSGTGGGGSCAGSGSPVEGGFVVAGAVMVGVMVDVVMEVDEDAGLVAELLATSAVDETSGSGEVPADPPQPATRPSATTNMAIRRGFIDRRYERLVLFTGCMVAIRLRHR